MMKSYSCPSFIWRHTADHDRAQAEHHSLEEQKQIVENSIVRCWDEFYPLKREAENGHTKSSNGADGSEYSIFS